MNIAIIGTGPSAFYTVQSLIKENKNIKIDLFDKLPAPYGLIRYGVAPDHQKTKNIIRLFSKYLNENDINYYGNIEIGKDLDINLIAQYYDAVIVSSGAPEDKKLNLFENDNANIFGSSEFVGWYNGVPKFSTVSPDLSHKNAVIIGNGNVALDCVRILSKTTTEFHNSDIMYYALNHLKTSKIENIYVIGRRTPRDAKFTIAELRELGELNNFYPQVEYGLNHLEKILSDESIDTKVKKNIEVLINFKKNKNNNKKKIIFKFLCSPIKIDYINGIKHILFKVNKLIDNKLIATQETISIEVGLVITAIGYKVAPINNLALDSTNTYFSNIDGHIKDNIYTNGWASGASVGVIGSNKAGAILLSKKILNEVKFIKKNSREKIDNYIKKNKIKFISKLDWDKLDKIEVDRAYENFVRNKFTNIELIFKTLSKQNLS